MPVTVSMLAVSAGLQDVIALIAAKLPQGGFRPHYLLGALADPDFTTRWLLQYMALESNANIQAWLTSLLNVSTIQVLLILKRQNPYGKLDSPAPPSNWLP